MMRENMDIESKKNVVVIIQARMGSTRFPGKALTPLLGTPLLSWVVQAAKKISGVNEVVVATSTEKGDSAIVEWCEKSNISYFQGSETDVLSRFYETAKHYKADYIVRITADCPLLNPELASQVLFLVTNGNADYATNAFPPTWPDGLDCEAFTFQALENAYANATRDSDREHVTPYIRNNQAKFKVQNTFAPIPSLHTFRLTVDTTEDLAFLEKILAKCNHDYSLYHLLHVLKLSPEIKQASSERNEGFSKSIQHESPTQVTEFKHSQLMLERALKSIPLGSQTFSKSSIQYPENTAPLFVTHGFQSRVWDVDGNEFIDMVNALMPNILGYLDPEVNFAIQTQLQKGISFSLATELEIELAEKLCEIIPSAEKVRFGKNGTDATSAAIRLARAYTGRDKVIVCGYHGWQDWYIGTTTRNKGIPKAVCGLSISVPYNDLDKIESLIRTEEYAAIIMEPCNLHAPLPGYLQGIKDCCEKFGSVLVFDEIVTGFRFSLGGAQKYFGITPHLSCFGKAMGNGMPISAIVGNNDIMREMENIFFSGTFGGETASIAASLATISKLEKNAVVDYLWEYGEALATDLSALLKKYDLTEVINLLGYSPWKILQFQDRSTATSFEIKTYFMQEMIKRGILIVGSHNLSYAHNQLDRAKILGAYDQVLQLLSENLNKGLSSYLESPAIKPLFKVR